MWSEFVLFVATCLCATLLEELVVDCEKVVHQLFLVEPVDWQPLIWPLIVCCAFPSSKRRTLRWQIVKTQALRCEEVLTRTRARRLMSGQ